MTVPSHAPTGYECPICLGLGGDTSDRSMIRSGDLVYKDELVSVVINSFFMGRNAGSVIVVPNEHVENLYELSADAGHRVLDIAGKVALAMKAAYRCDGITLRQNNEPAGDQHAFHFHLHVYPRFDNDGFNTVQPADKRFAPPEERAGYATKLKAAL